jgi:uncharacterized protein
MRGRGGIVVPAALLASCNGFFYHPDAVRYRDVGRSRVAAEEVLFASADGTRLHGWFLHARAPRIGTVVHFHGNAQNLTSHVEFVDWLPLHGLDVFVFDYRGYGESGGTPSRGGIHADCRAALDHVRARTDVDRDRIVVFGQSLGGACAVAALADGGADGVRGVALDSTFASYVDMGNAALGGGFLTWPLAWLLLSDDHSPADVIARLAPIPMLVVVSPLDPVVPASEGRALFAAAAEPKELVELRVGGHPVATQTREGRERLLRFFTACLGATPAPAIETAGERRGDAAR